jgi:hypothetical protein
MKIVEVERFDRWRDLSLLLQAIGFAAWWGSDLLMRDSGWHPVGGWHMALTALMLTGWTVWVVGLIWLLRMQRVVKRRPELYRALNDEGIVRNRVRAMQFSFWLTLIYLIGSRALTAYVALPAGIVIDVLIWLFVVGHISAYLWFSRH